MAERRAMETDVEDYIGPVGGDHTGVESAVAKSTTTFGTNEGSSRNGMAPADENRLEMRWLPGDLQSHVKDVVSSRGYGLADALRDVDRRSHSFLPWWIVDDNNDDDDIGKDESETSGGANGDAVVVMDDPNEDDNDKSKVPFVADTGHVLGALVLAIQAPRTTALVVATILSLAAMD